MLTVEVKVLFLKPEEEKDKTHFTDKEVNTAVFSVLVAENMQLTWKRAALEIFWRVSSVCIFAYNGGVCEYAFWKSKKCVRIWDHLSNTWVVTGMCQPVSSMMTFLFITKYSKQQITVTGWPQTWNTQGFLSEHGYSGNSVQPQGKIVTNKVFLVGWIVTSDSLCHSSFKYLCKTAVDWVNRIIRNRDEVRVRWRPVILLELMWYDPWWRSLLHLLFIAITYGKVSLWLWKSLENSGNVFSHTLWPLCVTYKSPVSECYNPSFLLLVGCDHGKVVRKTTCIIDSLFCWCGFHLFRMIDAHVHHWLNSCFD